MLNSCRLHWVPSTFSIMNICKGDRRTRSVRWRFLGAHHSPNPPSFHARLIQRFLPVAEERGQASFLAATSAFLGAGVISLLLPREGKDQASCKLWDWAPRTAPSPASSRPPARPARSWGYGPVNKAPGSCKSPTRSNFSDFCLSNASQALPCHYSESNETNKK